MCSEGQHTVRPALGASLGLAAAQDSQSLIRCGSKELQLLTQGSWEWRMPSGGEGICVLSYLAVLSAGTLCQADSVTLCSSFSCTSAPSTST